MVKTLMDLPCTIHSAAGAALSRTALSRSLTLASRSFATGVLASAALKRVEAALSTNFDGVYRFLRRLGVPERELEDAMQEVAIVATSKAASIDEGRERSFLFGVAYRVGGNFRRKERARQEVCDDGLEEMPDGLGDPQRALDDREAAQLLSRLIAAIPEDLRAVFVLHEVEEHSMADIAVSLELPPGTVASRLRRAREMFDAKLERRTS
jgi:RNA polymerase sigma-70 factor, ECF subfamily